MQSDSHFTQNWSSSLPQSIQIAFPVLPNDRMACVEVGSFEGRGSMIIADALCKHLDSRLYCIDPWDDAYTVNVEKFKDLDHYFKGQYERFIHNTRGADKIVPLRGTSDTQLPILPNESVDFAYIDGDHSPEQVYKDGINIHSKMKMGGILIFDDYEWEHNGLRCRDGIDRFVEEHKSKYTIIHKAWHLVLLKQ